MSRYAYSRSFTTAPEPRECEDGRDQAAVAIRKAHAGGPQTPDALIKGVDDIGKHRSSKSVHAIRKSHANPLCITGNRMLSPLELNKAFAVRSQVDINGKVRKPDSYQLFNGRAFKLKDNGGTLEVRKGCDIPSAEWNRMTGAQRFAAVRKLQKAAGKPRASDREVTDDYGRNAPESKNGNSDSNHADTGATNDWRDQIVPSVKPTRITFPQFGTPGNPSRDDAVEAIKLALTKPQRLGQDANADDAFARP